MTRYRTRDSAYSWLVCFSAGICQVVLYGTQYSYGVFFVAFLEEFGETRQKTAWTASVLLVLSVTPVPLVSVLHKKLSVRSLGLVGHVLVIVGFLLSAYVTSLDALFFTFSTLVGLGTSFLSYTMNVVIGMYFKKYMAIANSLFNLGASFGEMLMSPLTQWIITEMGLRKCFLIVAGLHVVPCLFALVYDPKVEQEKHEVETHVQDKKRVTENYLTLFKDPRIHCCMLGNFLAESGFCVVFIFMVKHCNDLGMSKQDGANLFIFCGVAGIFGRLLCAGVDRIFHTDKFHLLQYASFYPVGLATLLLPLIKTYAGLVFYMITYGVTRGVFLASFNVGLFELVGSVLHPQAIGIFYFTLSFSYGLPPPFASFLAEEFGSYNAGFYFSGCCTTAAAIILHFNDVLKKRRRSQSTDTRREIIETHIVTERETVL